MVVISALLNVLGILMIKFNKKVNVDNVKQSVLANFDGLVKTVTEMSENDEKLPYF